MDPVKNRNATAFYKNMIRRVLRSNTENLASSIEKRGKNYDSSVATRAKKMAAMNKAIFQ